MRIIYPGNSTVLDYEDSHTGTNSAVFLPAGVRDPSDLTDTKIVARDVLDKFGIPYKEEGILTRGVVNGYDIRNMSAQEAIRLSLAESMIDQVLVELYADTDGIPRFVRIGESSWTSPQGDVGLIAKSSTKIADQTIELVVIRGYDRPPKRIIRTGKAVNLLEVGNGIVTQAVHSGSGGNQGFPGSDGYPAESSNIFDRYKKIINRYASIVYQEPSWDDTYKNNLLNAYHPQCFESLLAWKTDVKEKLKNGYDPDAKIELSNNSVISIPITGSDLASANAGGGDNNAFQTLALNINSKTIPTRPGGTTSVSLQSLLLRKNVYGEHVYVFENVSNFFLIGQRVSRIYQSISGNFFEFADEELSIFELSEGSEYSWRVGPPANETIYIDLYKNLARPGGDPVWPSDISIPGFPYLPSGGGLGYIANTAWLNISVNLPSVNVYSPLGRAVEIANVLRNGEFIMMTPVVIQDAPAPVYYRFRNDFPLPAGLARSSYINHEKDLVDSDPTIKQDLQHTPSMQLQNSGASRVIDVSLPFISGGKVVGSDLSETTGGQCTPGDINPTASDEDIIAVRDFIFKLYNEEEIETQSQYIFSGQILKGEQPYLGAKYDNSNEIINSINYSMQDESSFQVTITTGKKIVGVGSWGTEIYERRTEQVSRSGTVTSVAGGGALYTVKVDGMGSYGCISSVRDELEAGDRVTVQIYNNPVEV